MEDGFETTFWHGALVHENLSPIPRRPLSVTSYYERNLPPTPATQNLRNDSNDDDDESYTDDDWETIEIRPQSLFYALRNKNSPPPPRQLKKKREV
jgi:hypothetical protein